MESEKMWDDESSESEEMDFPTHLKHSDLLEITKSYRDNLEGSGVEYIRALSSAFCRDNLINSEEYEAIEMLVAESRRNEACNLLFDKVITSADDEVLKAWKILERHQKLTATVNAEIERTGNVQDNDATIAPTIDLATDMKLGQNSLRSPNSQSRHPVETVKPNVDQEDMSASNILEHTLDSSPDNEQFDFPKVNTLKRKFDKAEKVQTGNFRASGAPITPVKDLVTEMNLGQNRRWSPYSQSRHPVDTVKPNVDQEDKSASNITEHTLDSNPDSEDFYFPNVSMLKRKFDKAEKGRSSGRTSLKTTRGHGTEIKSQYLIGTESDRHKLEHTEPKRHTVDKTKTRTVEAETNSPSAFGGIPRKTSTKLSIHIKSQPASRSRSLERLYRGIEGNDPDSVETMLSEDEHGDGNKSEKNVTDEASTDTATSLQEEETSRYDLGRTTEGIFGTSAKPTTELVMERKEQFLRDNESHRNKPQITEREEHNRYKAKRNSAKYKYDTGKELGNKVTEIASKDPTATVQEEKSVHGGTTGVFFGTSVKPTTVPVRERKEQLLRDNESHRNKLQMAEPEDDNGYTAKRNSAGYKYDAGKEVENNVTEIDSKDPPAAVQEAITGHGGMTGGFFSVKPTTELARERKEQFLRDNESYRNKLQMTEREEDDRYKAKRNFAGYRYDAGNELENNVTEIASKYSPAAVQEETLGHGGMTEGIFGTSVKPTTELVRDRKEQLLRDNESHRNKLQMTEREEDDKYQAKRNSAGHKYDAGNELENNVTEVTSKDPTAALQEEKSGHGGMTGGVFGNSVKPTSELVRERKEQLLRDNESQRNKLQMAEPEEDNRYKANRESVKKKNELEKKDMKITSKDPTATVQEKKAGHAGTTEGKVTEDRLDNLIRTLARYTDNQLYRVTKRHHEQLESAIIDRVEMISESLLRERWMTELDHEEMRALIRNHQRLDVSQQLLRLVLDRDIGDCRTFWNVLSKMQVNQQILITLLTQDVEKDAKRLHRNRLRSRSMKLKMRLISDIYVDPIINVIQREFESFTGESNTLIREVETHEIFKKSRRNSDKTTISVVYGAAGTGKTTLIQKITYDWATELKYDDFSFVLHFKIRNLNEVKGRTTLKALILETYPYLETYLDHLMKEPKRLLFIFDDFDRLHRSFLVSNNVRDSDPRCRCIDAESEYFVCDILRGLLQGYIMKGCSVLITTRVWKLEALGHLTVDSTFQIIGFTSEKVKEYFSRYLRHEQYTSDILQFIKQSDISRNMCCDPLFCSILASSLVPAHTEREEKTAIPIGSHTQVLSDYVAHLLAECGCDDKTNQKSLREVGELAYKEIGQSTLWLDDDALSQLNSCPPVFISAFTFQGPEKQSRGVTYEFRHSALRDFLAALTNILNTPIVRMKGLLDEIFLDIDERFSTFTLFLVGLSSRRSVDCLEMEVGTIPTEVASCISEWFTKSVTRRLSKMDGKNAQSLFLHKLYCLLEFGDNQLLTEVLDSFRAIKLNKLSLKPLDCTVLSETLIHSEVIEELDLSSCLVNLEGIERLELVMHRCVILRLNQNNLQDSGVKRLFNILKQIDCKIQTLELKSNHLTDDCLEMLFCTLSTNDSLKQLNLCNSSLDGEHDNRFTDEIIQNLVDSSAQQKEIRWLRKEYIVQGIATSGILTLITE